MKYCKKLKLPSMPIYTGLTLNGREDFGASSKADRPVGVTLNEIHNAQFDAVKSILPDEIKPYLFQVTLCQVRITFPHVHTAEQCLINWYLEVDGQVTSFYEGVVEKDDRWSIDNGHGYYNVNPETVYPVESFIAKEHDVYLLDSLHVHSVTLKDDIRIGIDRYDPINSNVRYMITARLDLPYEEVVKILRKHKLLEDPTEYV